MAIDKAVDSAVLDAKFTAIADAIREKRGTSGTYSATEMPAAIRAIETNKVQSKSGTFTFPTSENGYSEATINCGFIPDVLAIYLAGDTYTNGATYQNVAVAAFSDFNYCRAMITCNKFSTTFKFDFLMQRKNPVAIFAKKDPSGTISPSTVFNYIAYKFK